MDPIVAMGLVGTVIQFVDFGSKLLSAGNELYKSTTGSLTVNDEVDLVTSDLVAITHKLMPQKITGPELHKICDKAAKLAQELLVRLETLKVPVNDSDTTKWGNRRKRTWQSMKQALASLWSKDELRVLMGRLSELRKAIDSRVLLAMREEVGNLSSYVTGRFDHLDSQTQQIISALLAQLNSRLEAPLEEYKQQVMALTQVLSRLEDANQNEHRRTREIIMERLKTRAQSEVEAHKSDEADNVQTPQDSEWEKYRAEFFNRQEKVTRKIDDRLFAEPEALDVSHDEERRARTLVHAQILNSLKYEAMQFRYEDVEVAYPKTFDWLFDDFATPALTYFEETSEQPWNSFPDWLSRGSGVYWINGKAASGKSTLMRYIYDNPKTRKCLDEWTGEVPICLATFFFWNSGGSEQRSQSGLLRALLYQVFKLHPELGPTVFPLLWARTYSQVVRCQEVEDESWTVANLSIAFDSLIKQKAIPLNLFFLIDGLDEFEANRKDHKEMDYEEICELFNGISSLRNVKVCLSSRPWVVFEDNFHASPTLKLQNLTKGDIQHYTICRFQKSNAFKRLAREYPQAAENLLSEVVDKSDGVFLWVRVVVQSLLSGLMDRDGIQDLEKRLNSLPRDLEALYEHMLKRTDPNHLFWASKAFQIYQTSQHHRDELGPEDAVEPLSLLALYLACNVDKLDIRLVMALEEQDLLKLCKEVGFQMTARCAGLLEASKRKHSSTWADMNDPVRYMHRTARDFMEKKDVWKDLLSRTRETKFNPFEALMKSSILQLGLVPTYILEQNDHVQVRNSIWVERTATSAMIYAHFTDLQSNEANGTWLDRLDQIMTRFHLSHRLNSGKQRLQISNGYHWSNQDFLRLNLLGVVGPRSSIKAAPFDGFLSYAVQWGLTRYVDEKLTQRGQRKVEDEQVPLLRYAIRDPPLILRYPQSYKMVQLLLSFREDPNELFLGYSPWEEVLRCLRSGTILNSPNSNIYRPEQQLEYIKIIESLIHAGANPAAYIKDETGTYSALSLLCAVSKKFPEMTRLEQELRCRGAKQTISYRQRLGKWFEK